MAISVKRSDATIADVAYYVPRHASTPTATALGALPPATLPWMTAIAIVIGSWLVRAISITTNYDIFIDEVTYARIADNLATGRGLVLYGVPFDLHPPAALVIYAAAIKALGLHGGIESIIFGLRPFVALLGASICALVFLLIGRVAGWPFGAVAAAVTALDPFQIYYDSRVMLEAPAQLGAVLTLFLVARALEASTNRRSWALVMAAGLTAGYTICAKEYFGLVLTLTLLLCLVSGWVISRRKAAICLAIMWACCILCESIVILISGRQEWWNQVGSGIFRLIGTEQTTGFNSPAVHVSFSSRLAANIDHFGPTYAILAAGAMAGMIQVFAVMRGHSTWTKSSSAKDRGRFLVALWSLASFAYVCYATAFGALEEQVYYLLLLPALCTLILGTRQILPRLTMRWREIMVVLIGVVLVTDSAIWLVVHQTPDDEYRRLLAWETSHVPRGSVMAVTEQTAQFLLRGVRIGQWSTLPELREHHVNYVLLNTNLASEEYGRDMVQFGRYLQAHARVAFLASGPTDGELIVYDVSNLTGSRS